MEQQKQEQREMGMRHDALMSQKMAAAAKPTAVEDKTESTKPPSTLEKMEKLVAEQKTEIKRYCFIYVRVVMTHLLKRLIHTTSFLHHCLSCSCDVFHQRKTACVLNTMLTLMQFSVNVAFSPSPKAQERSAYYHCNMGEEI